MSYYITGIPVDLVRAVATFSLWLGAEPMLEKLDRVKTNTACGNSSARPSSSVKNCCFPICAGFPKPV